MEIRPGPNAPSLQVALASLPALARTWSAGQTLEALVLRANPAQGTVLLQLTGGEVEARSELPLAPGTRLQVTPERSEDGTRILLRVQGDATQETRLAALRQVLPREAPLAPVFDALDKLLQTHALALPPAVRSQAQALTQARPTPERLTTADGLRRALRDAGLELESRLADPAAPPPATDLKARLLTLLATLATTVKASPPPAGASTGTPQTTSPSPSVAPAPETASVTRHPATAPAQTTAPRGDASAPPAHSPTPEPDLLATLARHVEGALARIQLHQLQALPDAQPAPQWLFELPVRAGQGNDTLLLRFEREPERNSAETTEQAAWRVTLDLSHPEHGALRAIVAWRSGELSTRFFAERPATAERFRQHFEILGQRLTAAGIPVGTLEAHAGIPPAPARTAPPVLSERA